MRDFLKKLIGGDDAPPPGDRDEALRLAATALLFRALFVDGKADPAEEDMIRRIVHGEFGLDDAETESLLADARAAAGDATDLHGWTRRINAEYDEDEKIYLMELLWRVVLADGVIDTHESALMRRLAGLIYVQDTDSAHARARAQAQIGGGAAGQSDKTA